MEPIKIEFNPRIPPLPKIEDKTKINVRYTLISPYVSVHIYWDQNEGELIYDVEEPNLTEEENGILKTLESNLLGIINVDIIIQKTTDAMIEYIDKTSRLLIEELGLKVPDESYKKIFYFLFRDFIGLNRIEPVIKDYFIEDIECNGVDTPV